MGQGDRMQLPHPEEETAEFDRLVNVTESVGDTPGGSATGGSGASGNQTGGATGQPAPANENLDDQEVVPS